MVIILCKCCVAPVRLLQLLNNADLKLLFRKMYCFTVERSFIRLKESEQELSKKYVRYFLILFSDFHLKFYGAIIPLI